MPDLNPDGLLGGTFSPEDGNASPLLAQHAFYDHAREYGAEFRFGEPVTEMLIENGKVVGLKTSQGEYLADVIVNAAGGRSRALAQMAGIDLPVYPDSHEAGISEPVAHFLDPMIVDIRPAPGSSNYYFYQHATGQIVFCITPQPNLWGDRRTRDQRLPADGDPPDGGRDAEVEEYPGAQDLARLIPDDAGWFPDRGLVEGSGRLPAGDRACAARALCWDPG